MLRTHSAALVGPRCALAVVVLAAGGARSLYTTIYPPWLTVVWRWMVSLCRRRRLLLAAVGSGSTAAKPLVPALEAAAAASGRLASHQPSARRHSRVRW